MFGACLLLFAYIGWCSPLTGDDMEFASLQYETIGEYWTYVSQYGNGRFLGNLLAVSMPYLPLARIWLRAAVLASCVMLLPKAMGQDSLIATLFSFLLFVGVDEALFANVYAWASGFSNYIMPVWLTLIIPCVLNKRTGILGKNTLKMLIIFPLAVCAQLFMEHTAAINLLLSLWAVGRGRREKGSPARPAGPGWQAVVLGLPLWSLAPAFSTLQIITHPLIGAFAWTAFRMSLSPASATPCGLQPSISTPTAFPFVSAAPVPFS